MNDALLGHLSALSAERHPVTSPTGLRRAENYLAEQFDSLGLEVARHPFKALGGTYNNVVGTLRSSFRSVRSEAPLIIAAHYDTVEGSPGADDNASGLAVLLDAARALREMSRAREIRFIAFCLEEQDLLGSLAYAHDLKRAAQAIAGALVLECVGFTSAAEGSQTTPPGTPIAVPKVGDFLAIVGNTASVGLVRSFEQAAKRDVPALKTVSLVIPAKGEQLPDTRRSDHAAFWHFGYPALMLTDTANFRNPHYHRSTDILETLDLTFIQRVAKSVVATAAALTR